MYVGYWLIRLGEAKAPFGKKILANRATYLNLAQEAARKPHSEIESLEKMTGFEIETEWIDDLALHTQIQIKNSELCYAHGRLLYTVLSDYIQKKREAGVEVRALTILETGTARGFSALCMAKALSDMACDGTILTLDLISHSESHYWNCIDDNQRRKTRKELLARWSDLVERHIVFLRGDTRFLLERLVLGKVDFAFLDGAHTFEDVMFEFKQIRDLQKSGDIIVYDDYTPGKFPELVKAVDEICTKNNYESTNLNSNRDRGYVIARKR